MWKRSNNFENRKRVRNAQPPTGIQMFLKRYDFLKFKKFLNQIEYLDQNLVRKLLQLMFINLMVTASLVKHLFYLISSFTTQFCDKFSSHISARNKLNVNKRCVNSKPANNLFLFRVNNFSPIIATFQNCLRKVFKWRRVTINNNNHLRARKKSNCVILN